MLTTAAGSTYLHIVLFLVFVYISVYVTAASFSRAFICTVVTQKTLLLVQHRYIHTKTYIQTQTYYTQAGTHSVTHAHIHAGMHIHMHTHTCTYT